MAPCDKASISLHCAWRYNTRRTGLNGTGNGLDNVIYGWIAAETLSGLGGNDTIWGHNEADRVDGGEGHDLLYGGAGRDVMEGGIGNDGLNGEAGSGRLTGGEGSDDLSGGDNPDTLTGGAGDDGLGGGAAQDTQTGVPARTPSCSTTGTPPRPPGWPIVTDFAQAQGDRIDLTLFDANANLADDQAFGFIGKAGFSADGSGGELRYRYGLGDTYIEGDVNGDGVADLVTRLAGTNALSAEDFVL